MKIKGVLPYAAIPPLTKSIRGELHEALEIKTPYTKWFSRICEYGFAENSDFILVRQNCQTNNPKIAMIAVCRFSAAVEICKTFKPDAALRAVINSERALLKNSK